ncbi:MAG: acylneuraminate cytidylyltransferase family protein [Gammaproteobacteria bacterium]|nr:acylneuraminate cytidylyltransferase family protein [Gammaproteobacteria bacterium]
MTAGTLLIVIPARGGSKGLPRKNARNLGDLPLLGWTAEAVRRAGLDNVHCVLSTDDAEIAAIGATVGLETPFLRPAELATDQAGAVDVALHALDWLESTRDIRAEYLLWLQPTSPFRPPALLTQAVQHLHNDAALDAIVGVKSIYRTLGTLFCADADGQLAPVQRQAEEITRRQEVRPLVTPNGALYLIRSAVLRAQRSFFPPRSHGLVMDQIASHDIDDPTDWAIAEALVAAGLTWRGC